MTKPTRLQVELAAALATWRRVGFPTEAQRKAILEIDEHLFDAKQFFVQGYRLGLAAARRESKRGKGKR